MAEPEPYIQERPDEQLGKAGKGLIESYADLFSPWAKDEESRHIAEQPIPETPSGKIPATQKDIFSLGLPVIGETIANLAGPPGKGALWGLGKSAIAGLAGAFPKIATKEAIKKAEIEIARAAADQSLFSPQQLATFLVTANQGNPETIAFDLFQLAQRNPGYANGAFNNLPKEMQPEIDRLIGKYGDAAGFHPFAALKKDKAPGLSHEEAMAILNDPYYDEVPKLADRQESDMMEALYGHPRRPGISSSDRLEAKRREEALSQNQRVVESLYPWTRTYRNVIPSGGFGSRTAEFLDKMVLPHYQGNLKEFTDQYFSGLYNPNNFEISTTDSGLDMIGRFKTPNGYGSIDRRIFWDPNEGGRKYAYHGYLEIPERDQGKGLAKSLLRNQIDLYQKMGLGYVKLSANIGVGGYSWAKYGFLPITDDAWKDMSYSLFNALQESVRDGSIPGRVADDLLHYVERPDRHALWDFVDHPDRVPIGIFGSTREKPLKWGQLFMMRYGRTRGGWPGKLDLKDPETMERFNEYIQRKK